MLVVFLGVDVDSSISKILVLLWLSLSLKYDLWILQFFQLGKAMTWAENYLDQLRTTHWQQGTLKH
jgi:hypothetical protein